MKTVKLVDVTIKEVPTYSDTEVKYAANRPFSDLRPFGSDWFEAPTTTIDTHYVPITDIYRNGNPIVAVAYTKEFEEICEIPIRLIIDRSNRLEWEQKESSRKIAQQRTEIKLAHEKLERLQKELDEIHSMSFWRRLVWLFRNDS